MYYRINWHAANRQVFLESDANAAPSAIGAPYTSLGTFRHDNDAEVSTGLNGMQALADNHVLYQHVQDALYKAGVQDMQSIKVFLDRPRSISIGSGTLAVTVGQTSPLTLTTIPAGATREAVVYSSSDPTKATVNEQGVVKGVAAGSAVITAKTSNAPIVQGTRNVTVS